VGPVGRLRTSVADPGCLSRFPDPDFYPSRILDPDLGSRTRISDPGPGSQIPDPKTAAKERDEKNLVVIPFFVATNFTQLKICYFWNAEEQKSGPIFKELLNFVLQKLSLSSQKYGFGIRDPGSGKTCSRSRIQGSKSTGSRIRIRIVRIHDILGWIRIWIRGSIPLTNGSRFGSGCGSESCYFRSLTFPRCQQKTYFLNSFFAYCFLNVP
jgi:hypothetical protein